MKLNSNLLRQYEDAACRALTTGQEMPRMDAPLKSWLTIAVEAVVLEMVLTIERPGSVVCDCRDHGATIPASPRDGLEIDHHCDCPAVVIAARLLGDRSLTRHFAQCGHTS